MAGPPFLYSDFRGGLNTKDAPYLLTSNQARDLQNVQGTTAGAIVKRNGLVTLARPDVPLTSLAAFDAAVNECLIGAGGGNLYKITPGGTVSTIKTGLSVSRHWEWIQTQPVSGQGPLYGMNGIDPPQQWDGAAANTGNWVATTGTVPNGTYMVLAGNRLWIAGVPAFPSRVFFSDLIPVNNGPLVWPAANVSVFDENDGAPITGLGTVGPYVLVAKARSLYVITDLNTGDARRLSSNVGAVSHRSIAAAPEGTYFLAEDSGVFLTNGSSVKLISDQIQPTIDTVTNRTMASASYFNSHYYLSVGRSGASNDTVLDFDAALNSWWLHTFGSNQLVVWHPSGPLAAPGLYSAKSNSTPIVDQCFVPNVTVDNGAPFTWIWRGPWQSPTFYRRRLFPTPYFRKRFRQIRFDGAGTVDFSLAADFSAGETLRNSNLFNVATDSFGGMGTFGANDGSVFGGIGSISRVKIFSLGVYNAISVVVSSTSSTQDQLLAYVLLVSDRKDLVV